MVYHRNLGFLLLVGLSLAGRQPLKFSEHKTHEVNPTKVKGGCPKPKKKFLEVAKMYTTVESQILWSGNS